MHALISNIIERDLDLQHLCLCSSALTVSVNRGKSLENESIFRVGQGQENYMGEEQEPEINHTWN